MAYIIGQDDLRELTAGLLASERHNDILTGRVEELKTALKNLLADIDKRAAVYQQSTSIDIRGHYKNIPLSDGVLHAARAALSEQAPPAEAP